MLGGNIHDYSNLLAPNIAEAFALSIERLGIPSVRSLQPGTISTYCNEDSTQVFAREFEVFFELNPDASVESHVALILPALRAVMEGRRKSEAKSNGTDPLARTMTIPAVIAIRQPSVVPVPVRSTVTLSTTVSFYENDISYYVLPNGESLYPKEVAKYDSVKTTVSNTIEQFMPLLRAGRRISRKSWNVGRYILLVPGSPKLTVDEGRPLARAGVPVGTAFQYAEHIDMFNPSLSSLPTFGPWVPTQEDILADDWFEWK